MLRVCLAVLVYAAGLAVLLGGVAAEAEEVVVGSEKGGSASLGRGGKKSHRDNSLSARRKQTDGTREGSER